MSELFYYCFSYAVGCHENTCVCVNMSRIVFFENFFFFRIYIKVFPHLLLLMLKAIFKGQDFFFL